MKNIIKNEDGPEKQYVLNDSSKRPGRYMKKKYPPTWDNGYDISMHVAAPMHTLSLNIVKNTHEMGLEFA
eukprot:1222062-Ditylum_brightwellii.AAC.1